MIKRTIAFIVLACFTFTVTTEGRALAAPAGGPSAGGSAGEPSGKILESFHSDLATGRALFSIPLATPPGRRGVQPALGLSYSSAAKNGPVGVGWALELGAIERSTRFGIPKFDATDTFTAQAGGATGDLVQTAAGEYQAKDEQAFAKIRFDGTRWTVTSKDGGVATFGGAPDAVQSTSRGVVAWLLNQVQDIHGNVMTVQYVTYDGQPYPDSVQYTAHPATGLAAAREVRFVWEARPDVESDLRFGDPVLTAKRLQKVEAAVSGALVRRYTLSYAQSPLTGRSLLESVTTAGTDGVTSLPPVRMTYSNSYAGRNESAAWSRPDNGDPFCFISGDRDTGYRFEDLNADGFPDLIDGSAQRRVWINANSGWVPGIGTNAWRDGQNPWAPPFAFVGSYGQDLGARFADLNGDGRADLIYGDQSSGPGGAAYLNTGNGWQLGSPAWGIVGPRPDGQDESLLFVAQRSDGILGDSGMRFVELNGDGKTDLIQGHYNAGKLRAWINTGSGWARDDRWAPPFRFLQFAGSEDWDTGCRFVDLNGDGLTDLFYAGADEQAAYLNTGAGWRRDTSWNTGAFAGKTFIISGNKTDLGWRLYDANGDGLADLVHAEETEPFQALLNTGSGWTVDNRFVPPHPFTQSGGSDTGARFADLNGDGSADLYYGHPTLSYGGKAHCWAGALSVPPPGETPAAATPLDLLTRVENGVGGTTTLTYAPSSAYDHTGGDGIPDLPFVTQTVKSQTISNGMGWSAATAFTYSGGKYDAANREFLGFAYAKATDPAGSTAESWFHQDIHLKGRPYKQESKDSAGNLFARSENSWACGCAALPPGVHFCHLDSTTSTVFDGDATSRQSKVSYEYDAYGNVTSTLYEGDTALTGDEYRVQTYYTANSDLWMMAFPKRVLTTDAAGAVIAESWLYYDGHAGLGDAPTRGLLTLAKARLDTGSDPVVTHAYDAYGNKLSSTDPLGRITTTTYDAAEHLFPVQVANALGHTLQTAYDPGTGNILSTTDPNGQVTQNRYDALGRLTSVIGPLDTEAAPAVRYTYDLSTVPTHVTKETKASDAPAYYTAHSFADGLGRVIETRSPAQDPAQQIVTGCHELGPRGETTARYMPHFQPASAAYAPPTAGTPKTLYAYDAVGRTLSVTDPDGAVSTVAYSDWSVTATDANGRSVTKESDAYGRLIRVTEPATADHAAPVTQYAYDPAGRLAQVTGANGSVTSIAYDNLGRKISMSDPDMGAWVYKYDSAGNMTQQTDAKGQVLEFTYDALNRLIQKRGRPSAGASAQTLADYAYDAAAKPNGVGRLSIVTDPSGSTEFFYDLLGREIKTVKVIAGGSFTVEREYDPLNRLTRLLYPDGTDVRYTYSPQGITRVHALNADGSASDFLSSAAYNPAGETTRLEMGNGVVTDFAYDPNTLRIAGIQTVNAASQTLQDLAYTFDAVGNLTVLSDYRNSASQTFQYDALNRLYQAGGAYGANSYRFDATGNLTQKDNGMLLTYGEPGGAKPHAVTRCVTAAEDHTLTYDANGNLIAKGSATYAYDLQNRLVQVVTPGGETPPPSEPDPNAPFLEQAGLLCVEAEHPHESIVRYDREWVSQTTEPDYCGDSYLFADPNAGKSFNSWSDYSAKSPELKFQISVGTPGTYYVWLRACAASGSDDSVHVGLNNAHTDSADRIYISSGAGFVWAKNTMDNVRASVNITTPGEHTLNLWMREDGFLIDKILLTQDPNFTPTGFGPDESPRVGDVPPSPENITTTFTYDADGGRVQVSTPSGITTYLGQLYEAAPGGISRAHIFFGPTRIATLEREEVVLASARRFDSPFALSLSKGERHLRRALARVEEFFVGKAYADVPLPAGVSARFYSGDHLGSVNVITDQTGAQVELSEYSPYGKHSRKEVSGTGTVPDTGFGFTGKHLDSSTGLYYYGARYYDPELGRFIQPDSIVQAPSDPQTLNRYTYVRNNPLIYTDPTGHSFWKKIKSFFKSFGTAIAQVAGVVLAPFTAGQSLWLTAAATAWSGVQAAQNGQFGAWAAGIGAGLITAGFASAFIAPAMAGFMSAGSTLTAFQGGIITAVEFGLAGAAGGFAGTLAGGGSLGQAFKSAGIGFGIGAAMGGAIGYTYAAGMQDVLHGFDTKGYNATLQKYQTLYGQLTPAEKSFVKWHGPSALKLLSAGERAWDFARSTGLPGFTDGPADAVRHAAWGAFGAREVGPKVTLDYLTRHETFVGNLPAHYQMDMANNRVGIALGVDQSKRSVSVETLVRDAYNNDRLQEKLMP